MSRPGRPPAGELNAADRIREWFIKTPGELLTIEEIAKVFDVHPNYASLIVRNLVRDGIVKGAYCYGLNPERER